jgi:hypothetical protein
MEFFGAKPSSVRDSSTCNIAAAMRSHLSFREKET